MNVGKRFEDNWKKSVPHDTFYYRFKDGTSAWDKSSKTRFQTQNICDCMLFHDSKLFLLELKSHKGKSLPLSAIRKNQIIELQQASIFPNIVAGFVIDMTDVEECYFLSIEDFKKFVVENDRKSIPIDYLRTHGTKIDREVKKVNAIYDIDKFVNTMCKA